nr:uncharacterized protein LOC109179198 [Ipomoea batatas]
MYVCLLKPLVEHVEIEWHTDDVVVGWSLLVEDEVNGDKDDDLELNRNDEVDDVNVRNADGLVKMGDTAGKEFSESVYECSDDEQNLDVDNSSTPNNILSVGLNQIDLEGEKDCVESEDELRSISSNSDIEGENNLLVYREGDEKKT